MQVGLDYVAPKGLDAETVYRELHDTIEGMGRKAGLVEPEVFVQEFFARAITNGWFEKFDATKGRSARTYVLEMVRLRRQDASRDFLRRREHEVPAPMGTEFLNVDEAAPDGPLTALVLRPGTVTDDHSTSEMLSTVAYLAERVRVERRGLTPDALLMEMARRAAMGDDLTDRGLARHFGLSVTRLREVKAELASADEVRGCLAS